MKTDTMTMGRRELLIGAGVTALAMTFTTERAHAQGAAAGAPTVVVQRPERGILTIGIDRGPEATIDVPTFLALGRAYHELDHDDEVRVGVLYGRGPSFCRGIEPQSWATELAKGPLQPGPEFVNPIGTVGPARVKPLVVAVHGDTSFVGHELFLAADVRVAARDTTFSQGEVTRAVFPAGGATIRFVREVGWGTAMRYMLTGDRWNAEEAYRLGLVQELTPSGQELDRAIDIARKIAAAAPLAVRATLASAHRAQAEGEKAAYEALPREFGALFRTADFQERLKATREGRAPAYTGR
jgi:enoyl-CoA hydratase/carnithine racemase